MSRRGAWLLPLLVGCYLGVGSEGPTATLGSLQRDVFAQRCTAACHSGGKNAAGGLDMSGDLHAAFVGVPASAPACAGNPAPRVVPGDPGRSLLYIKVAAKRDGTVVPCGDTMPLGPDLPALSASEVELVRRWIEAGARDD